MKVADAISLAIALELIMDYDEAEYVASAAGDIAESESVGYDTRDGLFHVTVTRLADGQFYTSLTRKD